VPEAAIEPYLESLTPSLPFTIRPVRTHAELLDVARLRLEAYRISTIRSPEDLESAIDTEDYSENSVVLAAFEKATDKVIGTMRIGFSTRGKTTMKSLAKMPGHWGSRPYGEARMLCMLKSEHSRMVLLMLCKAFFGACRTEGLDNIIIGARRGMEPFYRILCFDDVRDPPLYFSPPSTDMPHRVLGLEVSRLEEIWGLHKSMSSLRRMFFDQTHSDIAMDDLPPVINPLAALSSPVILGRPVSLQAIASLVR